MMETEMGGNGGVSRIIYLTNVDYVCTYLLFLCHCILRRFLCSYGVEWGILACASQVVSGDVSSRSVLGEKATAAAATSSAAAAAPAAAAAAAPAAAAAAAAATATATKTATATANRLRTSQNKNKETIRTN